MNRKLKNITANKIYIVGPVGAGKTTLARKLSNYLKIPHHQLDNVVWKRNIPEDIKRTDAEISKLFLEILNKDKWIIEDAGRERFDEGLEKAELIIWLDINVVKRTYRLIKRQLIRKITKEEQSNKATLKEYFNWSKTYGLKRKNKLNKYKNKVLVLK